MSAADLAAPAPASWGGWLRRRLFASWTDAAITLAFGAALAWIAAQAIDWALLDAVWSVAQPEDCRQAQGACWAVLRARGELILFGLYPYELHWRSALACLVLVATMIGSCLPGAWSLRRLPVLWLSGFGLFVFLMHGGVAGMPVVVTDKWGGLALTLFIFAAVVVIGMPLSVAFALARRSRLPAVRSLTGFVIDVVRSLPLLSILFTAAVVAPLVLPDAVSGDKLWRVIAAYAVYFACYQAEIVRAGLQGLPPGQEEAAEALGLPWRVRVFGILLPQAFRTTLPATINQVVITLKETSIVTIIGFFEIMASGSAAVGTGDWGREWVEVYVFVAFIYFVFVFGLSSFGSWLERRARRAGG